MNGTSAPPRDPLLVRLGLRMLDRLARRAARVEAVDGVHFLNPEERLALRRIQRRAIAKAALAGAISTIVAATAEILATPLLGPSPDDASFEQTVSFWAVVGGVTVVASVIEILYLYWDALVAVHRMAHAAGLDLFPEGDETRGVASALARAALELPNGTQPIFGVDPRRDSSRLRLLVASLAYKAKVGVTNFLVKALVRRVLGRALVRTWLPFVAVPVTAAWNAVVCWLVVREARIRAMGPSAARELVDHVFERRHGASPAARAACVRAVASSIVRTEDLHPNLASVLTDVVARAGVRPLPPTEALPADAIPGADLAQVDDPERFLAALGELPPGEQALVLDVLTVASVIDGRLTSKERALLARAREVAGRSEALDDAEELRRRFVRGDVLFEDRCGDGSPCACLAVRATRG